MRGIRLTHTGLALLVLGACAGSPIHQPIVREEARQATTEELVRMRCSSDGGEVLMTWTGTIYAFGTGEPPRRLFDVEGMNVARCLHTAGGAWALTSRELMFYLDPITRAPLDRWVNPWTHEVVPVMHVANAVVQSELGAVPMEINDGVATMTIDVSLSYPDPLARDSRTRPYVNADRYEAGEFFTLSGPARELTADSPTTSSTILTWHRVGPWLPWMAMTGRPGFLVYSAHGSKRRSLAALPDRWRALLRDRLGRYAHAPRCMLDARNVTSWTYFLRHVDEYRRGATFPVMEPATEEKCRE